MVCAVVPVAYALSAPASDVPYGTDFAPDDRQFGPLDYYTTKPSNVALVERAHMGFVLANAKRSRNSCEVFQNLDYVMRAIPNHPQALQEMAAYLETSAPCPHATGARSNTQAAAASILKGRWRVTDADAYFHVALNFLTRDTHVIPRHAETHVLYGDWLRKKGRHDEAMKQFETARNLKPSLADTYYALGLLYLDQKDVASALENAQKAYSLGKPPAELRERLIAAGAWKNSGAAKPTP